MAKPRADGSKPRCLWQGRRARGRTRKTLGGQSAHPSLLAPWRRFLFGRSHQPLAPPPSGGYIVGGGGVAEVKRTPTGEPCYSVDELQFFDFHGLTKEDVSRETVLRRLQLWDAEIAHRLKWLLRSRVINSDISETEHSTCSSSSLELWKSLPTSKPRARRPSRRTKRRSK